MRSNPHGFTLIVVVIIGILAPCSGLTGLVSYADSSRNSCNVKGWGRTAELTLVLSSGQ